MKNSAQFIKMISRVIGMLLLLTSFTVLAQNKVVVIPLMGDDMKPLKNIITVAKANGDYTDPVQAVNSVTDASATNPYLVVIGPGVYTITQTLVMKEHVDISGSGENVTILTGEISGAYIDASSAIISGADQSTLSALTVKNTGGSNSFSTAIYNGSGTTRVSNVKAIASGGSFASSGIYNSDSAPILINITAMAIGTTRNWSLYNHHDLRTSSATIKNVTVVASGGSIINTGIINYHSTPTITDVAITTDKEYNGTGIANLDSASPIIRRSTLEGTSALDNDSDSSALISQSTLKGDVTGSGTVQCVACDNGKGGPLGANCK